MVASICNGFLSPKDKKIAEKTKKPNTAATSTIEDKKVEVVSVETVDVAKANIVQAEISDKNFLSSSSFKNDDIVSSEIAYDEKVVSGLSRVESAVKKVEEAIYSTRSKLGFFGSFFESVYNIITSPFESIKGFFGNVVDIITSPFRKIRGFFENVVDTITSPFRKMKDFFGNIIKKLNPMGFLGNLLKAPFKLLGRLFGSNKDSLLISTLGTHHKEIIDLKVTHHEELIEVLTDIKKAIKGSDSSLDGLGTLGMGAALAGAGGLFGRFFSTIKSGLKIMTSPLAKLGRLFGGVKNAFLNVFGKGGSVRNLLGRFLKNPFGKLGALGLAGYVGSEIGKFVNDNLVPDDIKKAIGETIGPSIDKVVGFFSGIADFFQEKFEEIDPGQVWANLKQNIIDSFSSLAEFFQNPFESVKQFFTEKEDKPEVLAEVPKIEEPGVLGFGKYLIDRAAQSFEEVIAEKPKQVETPILPKKDLELYNLNIDKSMEKAEALESGITQLETNKENFFRIERQQTIQENQNKQAMKILSEQSKANNYKISTGEKGRSLDNSPVISTDLGLVLTLGGGI